LKKIHSILLVTLLARLYHVTFPVLGWHSWRQSDTASIARNFFENGFNILYPQVNWGGTTTGYVESEFHIYPFIVSLLYSVFGVDDMWGRIVSIIFSIFTVYGIYLLVRKIIDERTALWSALIYAILPLNIYYGRAFMPESGMLMCSVYSIYFFSEWVDIGSVKTLIVSCLFTSLAILMKLPTLYIGLPLFYLAWQKYRIKLFTKPVLYIFAFSLLIPVILWYYHAHQLLLNNGVSFGIWSFGTSKWGTFDLLIKPSFYNDLFLKSIAERHLTFAGFILLIIGIFIKRKSKLEKVFDYWLIAVLFYFFIVSQGNIAQEYYQLPLILPASVFIGKVFSEFLGRNLKESFSMSKIKSSFAILCLVLIVVLSYLRVSRTMGGETWGSSVFKIAETVKSITNKNDMIITVCDGNPVYLYHCDRKGWCSLPVWLDSAYIADRKKEGAKVIAGEKQFFIDNNATNNMEMILDHYKVIKNEKDYFVVVLNP